MPRSRITTRNAASGEPLRIVADSVVRWSSNSHWAGLVAEHHSHESLDTPEFQIPEYSVILHLSRPSPVEHRIGGRYQTRVLRPGEASLFSAGAPRQVRNRRRDVLVFTLSHAMVARAARASGGRSNPELIEDHQLRDVRIEHLGRALQAEAAAGFPSGRLYGETIGVALAAHLVTHYSTTRAPARRHSHGGLAPHALRRVLEYIDENLAEDVSLDALARVADLSVHRFAHNFKQATGLAPHQYVIRERMARARRMLRTDATVAEVAYALGFGSPSRFALAFRRSTGVTPSAYRAAAR